MKNKIRKAVFPVAGMGSRFLPATKANPKEMMPIVDKPLIQYAVEEAVAAGVEELIFVTSVSKRAIEDHFDRQFELEQRLLEQGKHELLEIVKGVLPDGVTCIYLRQPEPLGLGHAILCAKPVIGDEPFAVLLADDLIAAEPESCLQQMVAKFSEVKQSVICVESIAPEDSSKYGVIGVDQSFAQFGPIKNIVEKPQPKDAPSSFGVVGRYILTPDIFATLEATKPDAKNEIQLTDAIQSLLLDQTVYAYAFSGTRYDCGSKIGYLQATIAYGLKHPQTGKAFRIFLQNMKVP